MIIIKIHKQITLFEGFNPKVYEGLHIETTFNYEELPFKASYIAGSQRYYKTGNHHQLTLTRTNKILLSDENGFVMKRKNIDSRVTIQKVFMPLVYPIFIMGGNYSVVRTTPWNLAQIGRSVYSDKNNLLMYNSWLDSRTEVVEVNKLKKRRMRLHLTDVTSMSISANQQLFAIAGKRCRMCDKRDVYIYKIEGIPVCPVHLYYNGSLG